jgi:AraC-like DNA-binding protein
MAAEITVVSDAVAAGWRAILGDPGEIDRARVDRWVQSELLRDRRPRPLQPAVQRTLKYLRNGGLQHRRLSANGLSQIAQLSPSRFQHVFTESLGIPLRPYVRWLRVQLAMGALAAGCPITEAAHGAGFADAAHLTRTLRRTLGHTPGELVRKCVLRGEMHRTTFFMKRVHSRSSCAPGLVRDGSQINRLTSSPIARGENSPARARAFVNRPGITSRDCRHIPS